MTDRKEALGYPLPNTLWLFSELIKCRQVRAQVNGHFSNENHLPNAMTGDHSTRRRSYLIDQRSISYTPSSQFWVINSKT